MTTGSLLQRKSFASYASAHLISYIGNEITILAMPWLILTLTGSVLQTSLAFTIQLLPVLLFSIPVGIMVDRSSRKWIIIFSHLVSGITLCIIPLLQSIDLLTIWSLYGASLILGISSLFAQTAAQSLLPELVETTHLSKANSYLQMGISIGSWIGAPLSGLLLSFFPAEQVLLADAFSFFIAIAILTPLSYSDAKKKQRPQISRSEIWKGMSYLFAHPIFRLNTIVLILSNFLSQAVFAVLIFHLKTNLNLSSKLTGIILGAWGVGMFVGAWIHRFISQRISTGAILWSSRLIAAIAPAIFFLSETWWLMVPATFITGISMVLYNISATTFRQIHTPKELAGRVHAGHLMFARISIPLGAVIGGFLAQEAGTSWVFATSFIGFLFLGFFVSKSSLSQIGIDGSWKSPPSTTESL